MKSVVLLSSGLDSTLNLYEAQRAGTVVLALTFDYGQRAAVREIENARATCHHLGIPHRVLDLTWFRDFTSTSLIDLSCDVPMNVGLDSRSATAISASAVWVPNRNGIFLNIAAGFAEGLGAHFVVPGFNVEEAATFPDNSAPFLDAINHALSFSTENGRVQVRCWTTQLTKAQIVARGEQLQVKWDFVWPCYLNGAKPCGHCESCQRYDRARAAQEMGPR